EQQLHRQCIMPNLDSSVLAELQEMLHEVNPYVHIFKQVVQLLCKNPSQELKMAIIKACDEQQYATPTASEVAVLMVGNGEDQKPLNRDIILHKQSGDFDNLNTSEDYCEEESSKRVTMMQYYAYWLQVHRYGPLETFSLHRTSRLFQQYIVDSYACIEQNRLNYLNSNQKKIRAELYNGLQDALTTNDKFPQNRARISQRIVLPSSFVGGPCHMHQLYQDAMTIVGHAGKPNLFITMTCNPSWEEIQTALLPEQSAHDCPDLCARVFNMKLNTLLNDILKKGIF
ncbi:4108_t:CDS:2, partial [Cetraspora pellucida]